jgi:hypothetical protein
MTLDGNAGCKSNITGLIGFYSFMYHKNKYIGIGLKIRITLAGLLFNDFRLFPEKGNY